MNTYLSLPSGYSEKKTIDLQKNTGLAFLVNGIAILIAVLAVLPPLFWGPSFFLLFEDASIASLLGKMGTICIGTILYLLFHELIHGYFIGKFSGEKAVYGFTGLYAFAGSPNGYFCKKHYVIIGLAPIVLLGLFLALILFLIPSDWFWTVYFLQIVNLSGAAGDLYVTILLAPMKNILVHDKGVSMTIYQKHTTEK